MKQNILRTVLFQGSLCALLLSCVDSPSPKVVGPYLIDSRDSYEHSTVAGNLVTTALKEVQQLDMVFYPTDFLDQSKFAVLDAENLSESEIDDKILPLYPEGSKDDFWIGTLSGAEIRKFVLNRTNKDYKLDLQVAGLEYDILYQGGLPSIFQIARSHGLALVDKVNYRVAISTYAYGSPFPGYRYGNSFEMSFQAEPGKYSARESVKKYLTSRKEFPLLDEIRAQIRKTSKGEIEGLVTIAQIQGPSHQSPLTAYRVKTQGIITAVAKVGTTDTEIYLQGEQDDGDRRTSNAVNVYIKGRPTDLKSGVKVEVTGEVYELITPQGLSRTAIRDVSSYSVLATNVTLPEPIVIGPGGLQVPNLMVSTYRGNVNQKAELNLNDGMDFWESLEGMLVKVVKPEVVGFRGGLEKYDDDKSYITVFVKPEGSSPAEQLSSAKGLIYNPVVGDFNPESIRISSNPLAPNVKADLVFNIGDKFNYDLVGIMSYQTNTFGDGEYTFLVTGDFSATSSIKSLKDKPKANLIADDDHLTVAAWNVENLSGVVPKRIARVGESIGTNLKCPDIITLPEIQDNNGVDFSGGSNADFTLGSIIDEFNKLNKDNKFSEINCKGSDYRFLNIDPVPNQDGGELGGNIRVAMIYNASRVGFQRVGNATALDETYLLKDGRLNQNPGRLYPNDPYFRSSRKPLVAEFTFKGQSIFVIGVHLNSKLGDSSPWSAEQPVFFGSEVMRSRLTKRIHEFAQEVLFLNKGARLLVVGDFNGYWFEKSLQALGGTLLQNLMTYKDLLPSNEWYSTNYDGNSASIDHIFASQALLNMSPEVEIVHLNSNFMDKVSDHDPVISRFKF